MDASSADVVNIHISNIQTESEADGHNSLSADDAADLWPLSRMGEVMVVSCFPTERTSAQSRAPKHPSVPWEPPEFKTLFHELWLVWFCSSGCEIRDKLIDF